MCKIWAGTGCRARAQTGPAHIRSNQTLTDQARRRSLADSVADGRVHTAEGASSRNAEIRAKHCDFVRQGGRRPWAAAGPRRNLKGTRQTVEATTGLAQPEMPQETPRRPDVIKNTSRKAIPEKGNCQQDSQARAPGGRAFQTQVFCSWMASAMDGVTCTCDP